MSNENAMNIAAINEEARRRDMTYGQLMALTTPEERAKITGHFDPTLAEKRRKESGTKWKASKHKK